MRSILLVLIIALSAFWMPASACSCFGPNTFCGVLNPPYEDPEWWIPDAVVMAVPLQQYYYGIDMVIVQVFQGEMNNDTVRVWGDNGALCRLYTGWTEGDTLILGLDLTDMMGNSIVNSEYPPDLERAGDYMISGCGVYLLDWENNQVQGWIEEPEEQTMSLEEFTAMVEQCSLTNGIGDGPKVDPIIVRTSGSTPCIEWRAGNGPLDLVVNDVQGRAVLRKRWDGTALTLDGLASGTYVVEVCRGTDRFVRKVAVI